MFFLSKPLIFFCTQENIIFSELWVFLRIVKLFYYEKTAQLTLRMWDSIKENASIVWFTDGTSLTQSQSGGAWNRIIDKDFMKNELWIY